MLFLSVLAVNNLFALLGCAEVGDRVCSNLVTLEHQNDSKTESRGRENGSHAPHPPNGDSFGPLVHIERDSNTESQPVKVENDSSLSRMLGKAFTNVVDTDRDDGH